MNKEVILTALTLAGDSIQQANELNSDTDRYLPAIDYVTLALSHLHDAISELVEQGEA